MILVSAITKLPPMKKILLACSFFLSFLCFAEDEILFDYVPDNLPPVSENVYVTAPQSQQEGSIGTEDPYGEKFDVFIFQKYPEIKKQKFVPGSAMNGDEEVLNIYKTGFYRAMYFSKLVKLANGDTLYDFITKCAKLNRTVTQADRERGDANEFNLQYYLQLKRMDTGEVVGESLYLKRHGNKFSATRNPFSFFALSDNDFMKTYGLKCFN